MLIGSLRGKKRKREKEVPQNTLGKILEEGFKRLSYEKNFGVAPINKEFRSKFVLKYVKRLEESRTGWYVTLIAKWLLRPPTHRTEGPG